MPSKESEVDKNPECSPANPGFEGLAAVALRLSLRHRVLRVGFEGAFPFAWASHLLRLKAWADQRYSSSKNRRTSGECDYFFAPELVPGFPFKNEGDGAEGFGFSALGFFGSRLLRF
jgi:hypothetical protein